MAEEKKEEKREEKKGGILKVLFGEKADRAATFGMLGVATGYVAKEIWKGVSGKVTEKGVKVVEKKIEQVLGLDTESAEKTIKDEECFRRVLAQRKKDKDKIEAIRAELKQIDPQKCRAFILYVARLLKESSYKEREINYKKDNGGGGKRKGPRDKTEAEREKYDFTTVNSFLDSLLARQTMIERLHFLDEENVFSLIPPEKVLWKSVKEAGCRIADKIAASSTQATEKTREHLGKNAADWVTRSEAAADKAAEDLKNYRENKTLKGATTC